LKKVLGIPEKRGQIFCQTCQNLTTSDTDDVQNKKGAGLQGHNAKRGILPSDQLQTTGATNQALILESS
jgi:hypothetical protein